MGLTPVRNLQLHNQIEKVLHVQGNYRGGILEMALVVDRAFDREAVRELCADIITSCKKQSEIFRNVRLNMVLWGHDEIRTETVAAAHVQMGTFFDSYERENAAPAAVKPNTDAENRTEGDTDGHKRGEQVIELMEYLKKFHARSKLVLLLTPDKEKLYRVSDQERLRRALGPFLKQKLILVYPEEMESGVRLFLSTAQDGGCG